MKKSSKERAGFWVGLGVGAILAVAILFSVYYVPRRGLNVFSSGMNFTVVLKEAHGLHVGSAVLISGIEAGEVSDVQIRKLDGVGYKVLATVNLFDADRFAGILTTKSRFAVHRSSLLGEMTIAIAPGGGGDPLTEGMLVDGTPPADFSRMLDHVATITKRLSDFMDGKVFPEFAQVL